MRGMGMEGCCEVPYICAYFSLAPLKSIKKKHNYLVLRLMLKDKDKMNSSMRENIVHYYF